MSQLYKAPHQFEPLLPGERKQQALLAKAHELSRAAAQLGGLPIATELRGLLRGMNSYYTNRIEGQHTRPAEIEQALAKVFSADRELARRQRLAVAHIEAEEALEFRYAGAAGAIALYSLAAVQDIHRELFTRLPPEDLRSDQNPPILPGELRQREVSVGQHVAPAWDSLPAFLARWAHYYGSVRPGEASLLALAAAHQRLGWIHPFIDGNGRVMRLRTHVLLHALGHTNGLWSPLRGFARDVDSYYARLADADEARRGDTDGRGNLSEQGLIAWIDYVLDVCLDQVTFMAAMLATRDMERRIAACLAFEEQALRSGVRVQALRPLHYLFLGAGELTRGEFKSMLGLGARTADTVLGALLKRGLLKSDSPQGRVRFGLPHAALRFYFPRLWPEAEADSAS